MNQAQKAAQEYLDRQNRESHPAGEFDNGGRFYLADEERCKCCLSIRNPSRRFPYSEMTHGRTMKHVANLYNVSVADVRKELKELS